MFDYIKGDAIVLPTAFVVIVSLAVIFRFVIKNKAKRSYPLKVLAVLIVCLEVAKQIYYNCFEPFTLYVLPLHFCSTFIWLMPLAQFTRGKFNKFIKPMPFFYSIIVMILMYTFPRVLLGNSTQAVFGSFHNAHTILYHHTIVAYFIFSVVLGDYTPQKFDFIPIIVGVLFYCAYALPAAYLLNVNYVNILRSSYPPFDAFRLKVGQVVYNLTLFVLATSFFVLAWLAFYLCHRAIQAKKSTE